MSTHVEKTQAGKSQSFANANSTQSGIEKSAFQFINKRPEATSQKVLRAKVVNSPIVSQLKSFQGIAQNSLRVEKNAQFQAAVNQNIAGQQQLIQKKQNKTGLPDNLKSGIEHLSNIALDDVQVHRNSNKPAQLRAHAFTQGTDIHLSPGQEKHLPHEAWHVVQQKQQRVKPPLQLKRSVPVNDEQNLENEADSMGAKALQANSSVIQPKQKTIPSLKNGNDSNPVIQGKWIDGLAESDDEMVRALERRYPGQKIPKWKVAQTRTAKEPTYRTFKEIAKALNLKTGLPEEEEALAAAAERFEAEQRATAEREAYEREAPAREAAERAIKVKAAAVARAPQAAAEEVARNKDLNPNSLIINYVWLGNRALGPLEKFNIYSWRALGHTVNIYTLRFDDRVANAHDLGINPGEANIVDLRSQLAFDDTVGGDSPKARIGNGRRILESMDKAIPTVTSQDENRDLIYNMVDMAKSYIGATQRGIVLDLKVGPSEHLTHYRESFSRSFVSYSRAGKTGNEVENQSMGTMDPTDEMRMIYAATFNDNLQGHMETRDGMMLNPKKAWFNQITGYHGKAFQSLEGRRLDVATKSPDGAPRPEGAFKVSEPKAPGHGPFRVFKAAGEQTNQGQSLTQPKDITSLADEVLKTQLTTIAPLSSEGKFVEAATAARAQMGRSKSQGGLFPDE